MHQNREQFLGFLIFTHKMGIIKIGTSGFSFKDWIGVFYPNELKQNELFSYYACHFNTVEINSTYYRIPPAKVFSNLEEKTSESFEFIVKVHKESTHTRKSSTEAMESLHQAVSPLYEKTKLKGFLAQFPYSYHNTGENRTYIKTLKSDCRDVPLFVEFRHSSWMQPAVYDFLAENSINYCCVDEPHLYGLLPPQAVTTGDIGYIRFHGRNTASWWDNSQGDRYNYLYNREELTEWIERIRDISRKTSKTYLFFNNCHAGHAVKNAKMMAELLKNQFGIDTVLTENNKT